MNSWTSQRLRNWVLGAMATGLLLPSVPAIGQTSNTPNFINKKIGFKTTPAKTVEPPKLLAVPEASSSAADNTIQPVSQLDGSAGDKSEVQKQLEALYEQDGREMPKMILQPLSPTSTNPMQLPPGSAPANGVRSGQPNIATQLPGRPNQGYAQNQPRTAATQYQNSSNGQQVQNNYQPSEAQQPRESPPSRNPVAGFFRRITASNKPLSTQAPLPPDFNVSVPASTAQPSFLPAQETRTTVTAPPKFPGPASSRPSAPMVRQPTQPTVTMNYSKPNTNLPATNFQTTASIASAPAELPIPISPIPPLYQQPLPLEAIVPVFTLPPLLNEPMPLTILAKSNEVKKTTSAAVEVTANDFPNPFPEVTETEADTKRTKIPRAAFPLDQPVNSANQPAFEPQLETPSKVDDNPYAVSAKDFSEPSIDEKVVSRPSEEKPNRDSSSATVSSPEFLDPINRSPASTKNAPLVDSTTPELSPPPRDEVALTEPAAQTAPLAPSSESRESSNGRVPTPEIIPEPHIEKMRKIRERFGMKGLKGFCPVTLHDSRELVDARIEFSATHRSQKFHFASAEARDKFEADPYRYAPAAYGADVVALSRDKDVVEGTLDFAAWFKGRLYLFESQKNYETFVANPAKFATLAGVE